MKRKMLFSLCSFLMLSVFTGNLLAQDVIVKKNGDKIKAVIKEVSDTEIRYADFNDPNGIIFIIDRALINEVKFSYGKKMKEEGPSQDESYYFDDKKNNVKVNFTAFNGGFTILTFERSIDVGSSFEASIKIPGLGIQRDGETAVGLGINAAYKLKLGSLFKKKGDYRPKHLLHGWYFRPNIGYTYLKTDNEGYNDDDITRSFTNFGLDFGIQWILNNQLSIDLYTGFHYYAGGITKVVRNGQERGIDEPFYGSDDVRGGDMLGDDNTAGVFGLRVGFLFNTKKKKRK